MNGLLGVQWKAAIEMIDRDLATLAETDPTHYYEGDWNELLDRRKGLNDAVIQGLVPMIEVPEDNICRLANPDNPTLLSTGGSVEEIE